MVSECALQLTFKKPPLPEFGGVSHIRINHLNENTAPFPNCRREAVLASQMTPHDNTSSEAALRSQLSSIEPDIKEICKNTTNATLLLLLLEKYSYS